MSEKPGVIHGSCDDPVVFAVQRFLEHLGVDMDNQHVWGTPQRVAKAWREDFLAGYKQKPDDVLKTFSSDHNELIMVKHVPFISMCAHHLIPFHGTAKIGYIPSGKLVGLSKLARLLDIFAKRLQIQEQLTEQVAHTIMDKLECEGVGVVIEAEHMCMTHRGVSKPGSITTTSCLLGSIRDEPEARAEFLGL